MKTNGPWPRESFSIKQMSEGPSSMRDEDRMSDKAIPNIDPEISNESYLRDSMWLLCFLLDDNLEVLFTILLHFLISISKEK